MKFCIYLVIAALIASSVGQCSAVRTQATRVQSARARRIDEAAE